MSQGIQFFVSAFMIFASTSAFGSTYLCEAGRADLVKFTAEVSASEVKIKFDRKQGNEGRDVKGRSLTLKPSSEPTSQGWKYFKGQVLVDQSFQDYVFVEIGFKPVPQKAGLVMSRFLMSPKSSRDFPIYLSSYDLNCKIK